MSLKEIFTSMFGREIKLKHVLKQLPDDERIVVFAYDDGPDAYNMDDALFYGNVEQYKREKDKIGYRKPVLGMNVRNGAIMIVVEM